MALIQNASNYVTKGINTAYGLGATAIKSKGSLSAVYEKYKNDIAKGLRTAGGVLDANASEGDMSGNGNTSALNAGNTNNGTMQGPAVPSSLYSKSSGGGSSSNDSKIIGSIGKGWDDAGGSIGDTRNSLKSSQNYINNLGKVRDQYLTAIDNYKNKTDVAIKGNKTLIEQNQKKDLDSLAKDTRKSMDNTNVMLGIKGANGGSASRMASRAIADSAGKSRSTVLTGYGDETSKQNQASANNIEDYNTKRGQAYEWEKTAREQAMEEYKAQKDALDRLDSNKSGWKKSDIAAMSDKNLNTFMNNINQIQMQAKSFRDNLSAKMTEYGGLADQLDTAAVSVDAPAELDTPKFDETIDLTDPNNATDWYDPTNTGKKIKVKTRDAAGNPVAYEDAAGNEVDENGVVLSTV